MKSVSQMLKSIKIRLGIYGLAIPIEDLDNELIEIIQLESLKTFSSFFPYLQEIEVNLNNLKKSGVNYSKMEYTLPDVFGERRILLVRDIMSKPTGINNGYTYPDLSANFFDEFMLSQAKANIASIVTPITTFEFKHPNKLIIYDNYQYNNMVRIEVGTEHFSNFNSIPNSQWLAFEKLAILDVKIFLYGILKHYNEIQTAHGTINLRIEDWQSAEEERKQLVSEWEETYHLNIATIYQA